MTFAMSIPRWLEEHDIVVGGVPELSPATLHLNKLHLKN